MTKTCDLNQFLRNPSRYTYVYLNNQNLTNQDAINIGEALKNCLNLQNLCLLNNKIGDIGAVAIAKTLKNCPNLERLSFTNNKIGDIGAVAIAEALKHCPNLERLYFDQNKIENMGGITIADTLKNCVNLKKLYLNNNKIGDIGAIGFQEVLKNCYQLKKLYLNNNQIRTAITVILKNSNTNCYKKLSYQNPVIYKSHIAMYQNNETHVELKLLLVKVILNDDLEKIKEILNSKEDVNAAILIREKLLEYAEYLNKGELLEFINQEPLISIVVNNDLEKIKEILSIDINERLAEQKTLLMEKYAQNLGQLEIIELINNDGIQAIENILLVLNQKFATINIDLSNFLNQQSKLINFLLHDQEILQMLDNLHKKYILPIQLKEQLDQLFTRLELIPEDTKELILNIETKEQSYINLLTSLKDTQEGLTIIDMTEEPQIVDKRAITLGELEDNAIEEVEVDINGEVEANYTNLGISQIW